MYSHVVGSPRPPSPGDPNQYPPTYILPQIRVFSPATTAAAPPPIAAHHYADEVTATRHLLLPPPAVLFTDPATGLIMSDQQQQQLLHDQQQQQHDQQQQQQRMALNVHLTVPAPPGSAGAAGGADGSGGHTPNTPEILNSIVNMQAAGPFAGYAGTAEGVMEAGNGQQQPYPGQMSNTIGPSISTSMIGVGSGPGHAHSPMSSSSEAGTPSSTMSVQHYRSQFIKEGLKFKVQQKLGYSGGEGGRSSVSPMSTTSVPMPGAGDDNLASATSSLGTHGGPLEPDDIKQEELTEEDELRRHRRRERNKVAATKCRNKKKLRTQLLMKESDTLEVQNQSLKTEINKLEDEKKRLMEMLSIHEPDCAKRLRQEMSSIAFEEAAPAVEGQEPVSALRPHPLASAQAPPDDYRIPLPALPAQHGLVAEAYHQQLPPPQQLEHMKPEPDVLGEDFLRSSCSYGGGSGSRVGDDDDDLTHPASSSSSSAHFLAKRSLGHTYLDMDSRCIAL